MTTAQAEKILKANVGRIILVRFNTTGTELSRWDRELMYAGKHFSSYCFIKQYREGLDFVDRSFTGLCLNEGEFKEHPYETNAILVSPPIRDSLTCSSVILFNPQQLSDVKDLWDRRRK